MGLKHHAVMLVLCSAVLNACQSAPVARLEAPLPCNSAAFADAATLPLPPAVAPARTSADKAGPLRFANSVPVNGGIGDIGRWTTVTPGWDAWRLRLTSEGAKSLSLHVGPIALPLDAELWLCSPDGRVRHGPFRGKGPASNGQFWSPIVPGPELWLEVLAPAVTARNSTLKIDTAFVGFR